MFDFEEVLLGRVVGDERLGISFSVVVSDGV
jgi:hypothetical protein